MLPLLSLRWAQATDYDRLGEVVFDAVRHGESPYSEVQRAAWVPAPPSGAKWEARLAEQSIILAEQEEVVLGFMSLAPGGYVDFAYIRPAARRQGLFARLLERIEEKALDQGVQLLWVHASLMAQPAFARNGFVIRHREEVRIGDQDLSRFEMEKLIRGPTDIIKEMHE